MASMKMNPKTGQYYQNVSMEQIKEWIKTNPNRGRKLPPIEISIGMTNTTKSVQESVRNTANAMKITTLEDLYLPTFQYTSMMPAGILACFNYITDPVNRAVMINARHAMLREFTTNIQSKAVDTNIPNLVRKRKKLHDWIGALANGSIVKDDEIHIVFSSIAELLDIQLVIVKKEVHENNVKDGEYIYIEIVKSNEK